MKVHLLVSERYMDTIMDGATIKGLNLFIFCRIFLLLPKRSFSMFASVFLPFLLPANSNPVLVFEWIHPPSSESDDPLSFSHCRV